MNPRHVGLAWLLIGNTAESVLEQLRCSVLAIKPSRFVSPVTLPGESMWSSLVILVIAASRQSARTVLSAPAPSLHPLPPASP